MARKNKQKRQKKKKRDAGKAAAAAKHRMNMERALSELKRDGAIIDEGGKISLTPEGVKIAQSVAPDFEQKAQEDFTLDHYRHLQETLEQSSRMHARGASSSADSATLANSHRLGWSLLHQAKVFHIDRAIYAEIYRASDKYVNEHIVGDRWLPPPKIVNGELVMEPMPKDHTPPDKFMEKIRAAVVNAPLPEKYPFDVTFMGFGAGIPLQDYQFLTKFSHSTKAMSKMASADFGNHILVGALVTKTGYVLEFYAGIKGIGEGGGTYMLNFLRKPNEGWNPTYDLGPWYIPKLIEVINRNRTFVIEMEQDDEQKRKSRKTHRKVSKSKTKVLWIPPPYYRLKLRDEIIDESTRELFANPPTGRSISYRHDVRGHERYRVRRGELPLDPKKEAAMLKRGYEIYKHTQPSVDHMAGLLKRSLPPKRPNEWMAIKVVWVDSHISPRNEELPYVPALRTTGTIESS